MNPNNWKIKPSYPLYFIGMFFLFTFLLVTPYEYLSAQENTCITKECHTKFNRMKRIHAPVQDDCTTCHIKTGKHSFKYQDKANLCIQCHDDKKEGKQVHEVITSGDCSDCHVPHGGDHKALLKTKRVDTLCFECHDSEPMKKKYIHGPNASGNCTLCHDAHSSDHQPLLVEAKKVICTRCHMDQDFSGEGQHQHSPMKQGCSGCHSPHSSDNKHQLIKPSGELCNHCHQKIVKHAEEAAYKHVALQQQDKCFNCHDPHGSRYQNNLRTSPLKLCLDCHNKPIIGTDGKDYNIYKIVTRNPEKHGPVSDGECSGCHDPHGSSHYKILTASYPTKFYVQYKEEEYGICFQCHESEIAQEAVTTTRTDFRDGDQNLHYIHVNRKKGRTCRACHEIHAGTQAKHVREETPFGKWDIPIEFVKTDSGGSCAPGCHKAYTYDRNKKKETRK